MGASPPFRGGAACSTEPASASSHPLPGTGRTMRRTYGSSCLLSAVQRSRTSAQRNRRRLADDADQDEQPEAGLPGSDSALPGPIRALPDAAFAAALAGQAATLAAYARRLTGQHADADDLLQETMLKCWAARHRFEAGTSLGAWARTIMRNSFLSGRRRARFQADLPEDALDRLFGVAESQSRAVELQEVQRAIGELTGEQRDAVLLASEGATIEEAAARLAIPEGTYKSRVARGRNRLRSIGEQGIEPVRPPAAKSMDRPRKRRDWKGVMIG